MKIFLNYFKNKTLQIRNNDQLKRSYKIFLCDYSRIFEDEWHPKGFYAELNAFKSKISVFEILPLLLPETQKNFHRVINNLNFFNVLNSVEKGYYVVYFNKDWGNHLLNFLFKFIEPERFKRLIALLSFYS